MFSVEVPGIGCGLVSSRPILSHDYHLPFFSALIMHLAHAMAAARSSFERLFHGLALLMFRPGENVPRLYPE